MENAQSSSKQGLFHLLFGLNGMVSRRAYVTVGVLLMALKYGVEAGLVYAVKGKFWTPLAFGTPLVSLKAELLKDQSWLLWSIVLWSLPFMLIGLFMSVRRARDAGLSPWTGTLFLFPGINYFIMLTLAILPSKDLVTTESHPAQEDHKLRSALLGLAAGVVLALVMVLLSVFVFRQYGAGLFMGAPLLATCLAAFLYNQPVQRSISATLSHSVIVLALSAGGMLLFALEGVFCLTMAFPIAIVVSIPGALLGRALAGVETTRVAHVGILVLALPLFMAAEGQVQQTPLREVQSSIVVNAPPALVWKNVIRFAELPPPHRLLFRLGIAYPVRARIQGTGVGAVRHCEFSTGPFVEPITRWEPPKRLSFDVTRNPPSMKEWSPYRHVYAPHLDHNFQSKRGEFRLKALPGGKTLLEGSTWYKLEIYPSMYWSLWANLLISQIHLRVLEHIKRQTETQQK